MMVRALQGAWEQDPKDQAREHDIGSASYVQSATCLVDWTISHSSTRAFPVLLPLACLCADLASSALLRRGGQSKRLLHHPRQRRSPAPSESIPQGCARFFSGHRDCRSDRMKS
jgi:hypothetical protein